MKIQEYLLKNDYTYYTYYTNQRHSKTIKAGTFLKPIDIRWVPKHIKEAKENRYFNDKKQIFCYCHYGIIAIDRDNIREAN